MPLLQELLTAAVLCRQTPVECFDYVGIQMAQFIEQFVTKWGYHAQTDLFTVGNVTPVHHKFKVIA